jgi:hypothetical protein
MPERAEAWEVKLPYGHKSQMRSASTVTTVIPMQPLPTM